jgi:predicted nucleotidyltransferase
MLASYLNVGFRWLRTYSSSEIECMGEVAVIRRFTGSQSSFRRRGILLWRYVVLSGMDSSGEFSEILDTLAESVCSDSDVEFAVAFGSRIAGGPTQASDIDLAVKFADDLTDRERFDKRCFLSGDLQLAEAPFVDVSDIETLPLDVAHDAVNGQFVCGDEQAFAQFKTTIEATFAEQRETLRRRQHDVIDRIAEDGLRG